MRTQTHIVTDIVLKEKRIAIEVNGPMHYIGKRVDGPTRLRGRLLEACGWRLEPIPYFEWDRQASRTDKQQYLEQKLGAASL